MGDMTGDSGNSSRFVSVKLLITILLFVVAAAVGLIVADTRGSVQNAQMEIKQINTLKLDKDQYYRDMMDIKDTLQRMDAKLDKLAAQRR
jgi:gas vesicle protein